MEKEREKGEEEDGGQEEKEEEQEEEEEDGNQEKIKSISHRSEDSSLRVLLGALWLRDPGWFSPN